jgi:hypothetical protein
VPIPEACRAAAGPPPHRVMIRFRNVGQRKVFFPNTYSCGVAVTISSCAGNFSDDLFNLQAGACPCVGGCPPGGPGCLPSGIGLDPGKGEELLWQASIAILGTSNGAACALRRVDLPAGKYRVTTSLFATAEDAIAGAPVLRTLEKDFDLPVPSNQLDIPFAVD